MNENENNVGIPTPVQPEPTPVEMPTPVETPTSVENVPTEPVAAAPVEEPAPAPTPASVETPTPEKKPAMNPVIAVLFVIAVIGGVVYGLYTYTDLFKGKTKTESNTTTTTTTSVVSSTELKSLDDYITFMNKHKNDKTVFIQETDDFEKMDFAIGTKCTKDGEKVEFKIGASNISYTCEDKGYDEVAQDTVYDAKVNIDNKLTIEDSSFTECSLHYVYTNGNYYLEITTEECSIGINKFTLYDYNGNVVVKDVEYNDHFMANKDVSDYPILKLVDIDNVLYFMSVDSRDSDENTTCRFKSIDLNGKTTPEIKEMGTGTSCYYNGW